MYHLEKLIRQFYEWQGYIVKGNIKVGRLSHGGWEGELDVVVYHPLDKRLMHLEPSIDALSWAKREERFKKKFAAGRKYIIKDVFPWLEDSHPIEQIAILITESKKEISGAKVKSIDRFISEIKNKIKEQGVASKSAIPEEFDLLRTIQFTECGYYKLVKD